MGVNKNVFASKSERDNFYRLSRTWGEKYHLYHNLPFLNVFTTDNLTIDQRNIQRLKKTSIDYVLCDDADIPLVCVEFDGMQQGINVGTSYYPAPGYKDDEWRKTIMSLKLTVAHASNFAYIVVGSAMLADLSEDVRLTILDGIIGEILAKKVIETRFREGFSPNENNLTTEEFDSMSSEERGAEIEWWVTNIETDAGFEHNPIVKKRWDLWEELGRPLWTSGLMAYPKFSIVLNRKPDDPIARINEDYTDYSFADALWYGQEIVIHSKDFGDIRGVAWIPKFNVPYLSGMPYMLLEDIACLFALDRLKQLQSGH
jgi:hypothetical protein